MGNTRYFLSNSREIPVFPAGMGNTHKSRDFANPGFHQYFRDKMLISAITSKIDQVIQTDSTSISEIRC